MAATTAGTENTPRRIGRPVLAGSTTGLTLEVLERFARDMREAGAQDAAPIMAEVITGRRRWWLNLTSPGAMFRLAALGGWPHLSVGPEGPQDRRRSWMALSRR